MSQHRELSQSKNSRKNNEIVIAWRYGKEQEQLCALAEVRLKGDLVVDLESSHRHLRLHTQCLGNISCEHCWASPDLGCNSASAWDVAQPTYVNTVHI